ncbi:hypothetical protein Purlil1_7643 [Purpureocillium lilacinum]|uniref:AMP-activated protein kinase glycogen-binding domain-containing protein n=1 Tax=Purpureocillium lilacinum TaxID=33203 RepID=A0ABR0BV75_PURLI|nr:hypothetical protein Purlil1_7643 [Purpureocillium lilacinum]
MGSYTFKWEHPAEEAYVTGTFDNWQKTVKLEKSDGVFQKTVDIAHPSHKIYYKVRGRKPGVVPFLRVFGSSMAVSLAELHDCTPGLVKHGFAAPSVCLRDALCDTPRRSRARRSTNHGQRPRRSESDDECETCISWPGRRINWRRGRRRCLTADVGAIVARSLGFCSGGLVASPIDSVPAWPCLALLCVELRCGAAARASTARAGYLISRAGEQALMLGRRRARPKPRGERGLPRSCGDDGRDRIRGATVALVSLSQTAWCRASRCLDADELRHWRPRQARHGAGEIDQGTLAGGIARVARPRRRACTLGGASVPPPMAPPDVTFHGLPRLLRMLAFVAHEHDRFVVDNNWTINESSPHEPDSDGNVNNFLTQADLEHPSFSSSILNTVTPESTTVAMAGKKNNKKKQQQKAQQAAAATKPAETAPAETAAAAPVAAEVVPVEAATAEPTAAAATTAAVVEPVVPVAAESREDTATPSIVPGGFPETPANEEDKTVSVNPLPAAPGAVNPITLEPGEKIPQGVAAQGVNDNVKLDKESYEKSDALPGVVATDLPPVSKNTIPESSLPITSNKDATINTVGPGATTAALAGQVPLESKDAKVPEVVKESQEKAGVAPEASAVPEEVKEKAAVEEELKSKVQEAPGTSEGHAGVGAEKQENTGLIAGAALTTGGAVAAAAIAAKDKVAETAGPTVNNAAAAATDAANKNLPDSVKAQLPEAAQNHLAAQSKETTLEEVSPQVPAEVKESLTEAGKSPEAAANTEAVVEKKQVESELLKEVKSVPAVDETKPAAAAASETKPVAAKAPETKPTETPATQGKATEANPEAAKAEAVKAGAANGANGTETKPAEASQPASAQAKKKSRLSTIFSKLKEKLK